MYVNVYLNTCCNPCICTILTCNMYEVILNFYFPLEITNVPIIEMINVDLCKYVKLSQNYYTFETDLCSCKKFKIICESLFLKQVLTLWISLASQTDCCGTDWTCKGQHIILTEFLKNSLKDNHLKSNRYSIFIECTIL